jgi:hypothetical protein
LTSAGVRVRFALSKWYLDITTPDGAVAIFYVGRLRLGLFYLPYNELITFRPGRGVTGAQRWSSRATIETNPGGSIGLDVPALKTTGVWRACRLPVERALLDAQPESIEWSCFQFDGPAVVRLPSGERLEGHGYVEKLELTCRPWRMPFDELRWGRLTGAGCSVTWIDWRGGEVRRWVFVDGEQVAATRVDEEAVEWPGGRVELHRGDVLRNARIGRTVAGPFAFLLPTRIAQATETKWVATALLCDRHGEREGRVIHEVVRWPRAGSPR